MRCTQTSFRVLESVIVLMVRIGMEYAANGGKYVCLGKF